MITKVINVNLHQPIYERLTAKQGDIASRYLLFHLLDGDKPFDLSNRTVRVYAIKPDKTEIFNDLTINDASKGYCTLELTSQCLAEAGIVKMELYISQSGKVLTSIPFELEVIACINTANGVVSTNEFSALEIALSSLQDYDNLRSEIVQARKGYRTVGGRLDNFDLQLDTIANNILNYGGNYNGVNSNDNAFNLAKGKGSVFFPQNETKNAVYYFENTPNMDNVVIESQENVILSFPTTNYISFKKAKIQNTIKIISRDRDNVGELITNTHSKQVYNSINQDIFGVKKLKQYNLNNLKGTRRFPNNKDVIDITQYIFKENRKLNWNTTYLDYGVEYMNLYELTDFEIGNMYLLCSDVGLLTDDDIFYITIADENKTFSAFQSNRKEIYYKGTNATERWIGQSVGNVISPAYRLADGGSCIWSIRVINANTVEIYINNVFITTLTLNNFTRIGFGFNSIASTIKTNFIQNILYSKVDKASYGKNLKIAIFGDSISYGEGANIGWAEHLENMLVGYRGIAKVTIDNFAVSGETSGQQLVRLQSNDMTNYDFVCVMVGTNDLGQQVDLVTFKNNISNIIDKIINDGSIPIIGVFPMTTSRELTGYGVDNFNYFNGGKYRSIIMEVCSEKDVIIADIMGELGQIGADNTQLRDNVHINTSFNVLISKSFSNSIKYKISSDF